MLSSILISLIATSPAAHAEGSAQLPGQWLLVDSVLFVDIIDPETERISFDGAGGMVVRAPDGTDLGVLPSGSELALNGLPAGAYQLHPQVEQRGDWDLSVVNATDGGGRVSALDWTLDARGYDDPYGFDGMFYARVDGGEDGRAAVIALELAGWTGHRWNALATGHGVDGWDAGRSVDRYLAEVEPNIPLYLSPPSVVGDPILDPDATGLTYTMNDRSDEFGGVFTFDVNARGTWRVVCDTVADGVLDPTDNLNVVLSGESDGPESVEVEWDGHTWDGGYISGSGECGVTLSVGELHFLADDIETAYPGLRTFLDDGGSLEPAPMFWNDAQVAGDDVPMPDGVLPLVASGADGILPAGAGSAPEANVDARSWGNFDDVGKGDRSMLDTWTFAARSTPDVIAVDDFGGPGDRNDSSNDNGSGAETPEPELVVEGLATGGYYKGGCSTAASPAGSAGVLALLAGLVGFGLRRRDD